MATGDISHYKKRREQLGYSGTWTSPDERFEIKKKQVENRLAKEAKVSLFLGLGGKINIFENLQLKAESRTSYEEHQKILGKVKCPDCLQFFKKGVKRLSYFFIFKHFESSIEQHRQKAMVTPCEPKLEGTPKERLLLKFVDHMKKWTGEAKSEIGLQKVVIGDPVITRC